MRIYFLILYMVISFQMVDYLPLQPLITLLLPGCKERSDLRGVWGNYL
jgi:hypothetical protein